MLWWCLEMLSQIIDFLLGRNKAQDFKAYIIYDSESRLYHYITMYKGEQKDLQTMNKNQVDSFLADCKHYSYVPAQDNNSEVYFIYKD